MPFDPLKKRPINIQAVGEFIDDVFTELRNEAENSESLRIIQEANKRFDERLEGLEPEEIEEEEESIFEKEEETEELPQEVVDLVDEKAKEVFEEMSR